MLSIIKTAIITIIISFISGVLLDGYKNFAPRIQCSMEKPVHLKINNKKVWVFTFIMRNISNKTIHNLSLNIQGHYDNLRIDEARITKGLRFETSSENNNYNICIPFLSKNDEFLTKIFVEGREGIIKKPIVTLRSPENFKQVNGSCKNGYFATIAGIPQDISEVVTKRNHKSYKTNSENKKINNKDKNFFNYKKILAAMMAIVVLIYAGILADKYYNNMTDEFTGLDNKVNTQQAGASLKQSEPVDKPSGTERNISQGSSKNNENTGSTNSAGSTNSNSSRNKVPNDTYSKKSPEDSNKDENVKANVSSNTDTDKKVSNNSESKNNSTSSKDKEKSEENIENSKTDNNKVNNAEDSKTDKSSSKNIENEKKEASEKAPLEKTPDQGKSKLQSNSSSNQKQENSSTSEPGSK
ncbi:MAG TPA: hypothetical protein DG753_13460 [Clostridium sp.]|nr:hypothetical protein [Clostridium sp.]